MRPERPHGCPDDVFALMQRCWSSDPAARPTFQSIARELSRILIDAEMEMAVLRDMGELVALARTLHLKAQSAPADSKIDDDGYAREDDVLAKAASLSAPGEYSQLSRAAPGNSEPAYSMLSSAAKTSDYSTPQQAKTAAEYSTPQQARIAAEYNTTGQVRQIKQRGELPQIFEETPAMDFPPGITAATDWYFGPITRNTAERILLTTGKPAGSMVLQLNVMLH